MFHILYNGNIITMDERQPRASALAILNGRIVAAGSDADVLALVGAGTTRENLNGRTVLPGLVDAHIHWEWTTRALHQVEIFEIPSRQLAVERVKAFAERLPAGEWITGHGWSQEYWADLAFPTAAELDPVTPQHPVYLRAKSGHAGWVNSVALRICGINRDTPDPEGGQIVRDAEGNASGLLLETAMDLVSQRVPNLTPPQLAEQMRVAQAKFHASGLVGFHDFDNPSSMIASQILRERGQLGLRILKHINKAWLAHALEVGIRSGFGDDWIRIGALKLFADGALGPRTALMIEPYEGEPENYGMRVVEKEEMTELVTQASAAGLSSTVHAIGDRAVHDVLDVYEIVRGQEAARGETPAMRRHRIEHVQLIHPTDKHRLAELDIIASMQPMHATSDYEMSERYWGARSQWAYNARLQIDQGVKYALGTDSPVEPFEPFKSIYAAVTRRRLDGTPGVEGWYPELRLTVDEALRGYTLGSAYAAGTEDHTGRLAAGYLADLIVVDRDPYRVPPDELLNINVQGTMVDGLWRFGGV
ncbi:MAG: amidohydrolase [Anaerolineae bacterium]